MPFIFRINNGTLYYADQNLLLPVQGSTVKFTSIISTNTGTKPCCYAYYLSDYYIYYCTYNIGFSVGSTNIRFSNITSTLPVYYVIVGQGGGGGGNSGGGGGAGAVVYGSFNIPVSNTYDISLNVSLPNANAGASNAAGSVGSTSSITYSGTTITAAGGYGGSYLSAGSTITSGAGGSGGGAGSNTTGGTTFSPANSNTLYNKGGAGFPITGAPSNAGLGGGGGGAGTAGSDAPQVAPYTSAGKGGDGFVYSSSTVPLSIYCPAINTFFNSVQYQTLIASYGGAIAAGGGGGGLSFSYNYPNGSGGLGGGGGGGGPTGGQAGTGIGCGGGGGCSVNAGGAGSVGTAIIAVPFPLSLLTSDTAYYLSPGTPDIIWYKCDSTTYTGSGSTIVNAATGGSAYNGTYYSTNGTMSIITTTTTYGNKGMQINHSTNNSAVVSNAFSVTTTNNSGFSICFWAYMINPTGRFFAILNTTNNSAVIDNVSELISIYSYPGWNIQQNGFTGVTNGNLTLPVKSWFHFTYTNQCVAFGGTSTSLGNASYYINGVKINFGTNVANGYPSSTMNSFVLALSPNSIGSNYIFRDIRIYGSTILSQANINWLVTNT